eukprot:CAMPEP_0185268426 /NCGR_PEP_ID=MMETSP1359-20130426/37055_1 /TAXON_ID=552665 /ORGANISM="Bigelowiella longifila, Strain CCMP242" /LENGTH=58 /DNA_ID=CAMNT_0027859183 /DNA_START=339 /DNA_END=515 /DNA_ORIENTATION=-
MGEYRVQYVQRNSNISDIISGSSYWDYKLPASIQWCLDSCKYCGAQLTPISHILSLET